MSDFVDMFVGFALPLFFGMATFIGTIALLVTIDSMWGLLLFLTWPFILSGIAMFILWWGDR